MTSRIIIITILLLTGCTDAQWSRTTSLGSKFKVTMYSGGQPVREFTSTGKVLSEEHSDGWYFMDADTKKLVRISGDVVVEEID